jgi:nitrate reductase gamma subunit
MGVALAVATYVGYIFIILMYSIKIVKYLRLPIHLRSEIYPFVPSGRFSREESYFEDLEWWAKPWRRRMAGRVLFLVKDYFVLSEYFHRHKSYWLALYPWHIGFISIIAFHVLSFFGALVSILGAPVTPGSSSLLGAFIYHLSLYVGVISFLTGFVGSIGILMMRLTDKSLKDYATPLNYFTYFFLLAVFLSGLYSWYSADPTFAEYRAFWKGVITFEPIEVGPAATVHILLFALLLIYLPFTRSLHYVTRLLAFFLIRWDDEPNVRGGPLERKIEKLLDHKLRWSGPHIRGGATWSEVALESISQGKKAGDDEKAV